MSFILDALRRADAERERERGQLPDLHARSLAPGPTPRVRTGRPPWAKLGAAALALLLAAAVGWQWRRDGVPPAPQATPPTPAQTQVAAPLPGPGAAPLPSAVPPRVPAVVAVTAAPLTPAPVRTVEPVPPAQPEPAPPRTSTIPTPTKAAAPAPEPASPRPAVTPEVAAGALPPVKVGGVTYAESSENRVLVINDQVLREGESVQPGLVLEHIGPKSAKLRWKDQVVEVPY